MEDAVVLLVDDDASVRKSLSRLMRSAGYTIQTFASAEEFLSQPYQSGCSCLLLDIQMPGLNGLQLQEKLAAAEYVIPIIFITGHGTIPISVKAMKAGAADFLSKPFKEKDLFAAINQALEKHLRWKKQESEIQEIQDRMNALTHRESEVLHLVVQGLMNKQIGVELGIAEKTVKVHRSRVMEKMRVNSVAELVHLMDRLSKT